MIQYLDIGGTFYKHVLAPRATTQERMNLYFIGTEMFMAERYTVRMTCCQIDVMYTHQQSVIYKDALGNLRLLGFL